MSRGRMAALSCSLGAHALVAVAFAMDIPHQRANALGSPAEAGSAIEVSLVSNLPYAAPSAAAATAKPAPAPIDIVEATPTPVVQPVTRSQATEGETSDSSTTGTTGSASAMAATAPSAPGDAAGPAHAPRDPAADSVGREYRKRLLAHIQPYRRYPREAHGEGGAVQLLFVIQRSGAVTGVWVTRSSGEIILDDAAVQTLLRAQPLPPIPAALPDSLSVSLPVAFNAP